MVQHINPIYRPRSNHLQCLLYLVVILDLEIFNGIRYNSMQVGFSHPRILATEKGLSYHKFHPNFPSSTVVGFYLSEFHVEIFRPPITLYDPDPLPVYFATPTIYVVKMTKLLSPKELIYLPLETNFVWCVKRPAAVKLAAYFYQMRPLAGELACLDRVLFRRNYGKTTLLLWDMSIVRFLKVVKSVELDVGMDLAVKKVWSKNYSDVLQSLRGSTLTTLFDEEQFPLVEVILLGNISFSFVTCGSMGDEGLRFSGYVQPFQKSVWLAIFICSAGIAMLIMSYGVGGTIQKSRLTQVFTFVDVLAINLEISLNIKRFKGEIKTVVLIFVLVSILTINVYKSVVTNDITAPLGTFQPDLFSQLVSHYFKLIGLYVNSDMYREDSGIPVPITFRKYRVGNGEFDEEFYDRVELWKRKNGLDPRLNSTINSVFRYFICKSFIQSGDLAKITIESPRWYCRNKTMQILKTHSNLVNKVENMFNQIDFGRLLKNTESLDITKIPHDIANCKKTALVLRTRHLTRKHLLEKMLGPGGRSHKNRRPYVTSKDTLFSRRVFLMMTKSGWYSAMVKFKFAGVFEGGLYNFWENVITFAHTTVAKTNMLREDDHPAQKLQANIGTSFIILLIGLFLSGGVAFCENPKGIWKVGRKFMHKIYGCGKVCRKKVIRVRKFPVAYVEFKT